MDMLLHNLPYMATLVLGCMLAWLAGAPEEWGWAAVGVYVAYFVAAWAGFIRYVCARCPHARRGTCPVGYGRLVTVLGGTVSEKPFVVMYWLYLPLMLPVWLLPVAAGVWALGLEQSTVERVATWALLALFVVNAGVVMPWAARGVDCGCRESCEVSAGEGKEEEKVMPTAALANGSGVTRRLRRDVHFGEFLKVLRREGRPRYLPFWEHVASSGFIAERTGTEFDRMSPAESEYWRVYVDFWVGMGYDVVPIESKLRLPLPRQARGASHESEAHVVIRSWEDFHAYAWPKEGEEVAYEHYEMAARHLPEGVKLGAGPGMGPYEWVSNMLGVQGMSYLLADDPDLVEAVFRRVGALHVGATRQLASWDAVCALRQGDDLGYKTSTFLPPDALRDLVFPIYTAMADAAHAKGKPFILHSCGNLEHVYEDLITTCRIDAKHSFEDVIMPVEDFARQYGKRVTPLGGLDVDMICRTEGDELRNYARRKMEACLADGGYWALGTGNSLTNYMPVENYLTVLEVGMEIAHG